VTGGELLIYGKFLLTFGLLLGIPAWELLRLARDPGPRTPWPRARDEAHGQERHREGAGS
jgi:hypothetical protein